MAADEKWYFTKEQLANTPSRKCGYEVDKELSYRQQAANFIQDMGQRLQVYPFPRKDVMLVYSDRSGVSESISKFSCEERVLYNTVTCFEVLEGLQLIGAYICRLFGSGTAKKMCHTWHAVLCISRHAILIM
jgi:hypothetical protein